MRKKAKFKVGDVVCSTELPNYSLELVSRRNSDGSWWASALEYNDGKMCINPISGHRISEDSLTLIKRPKKPKPARVWNNKRVGDYSYMVYRGKTPIGTGRFPDLAIEHLNRLERKIARLEGR